MAYADGFVVPHLRRSIEASRALASQLFASDEGDVMPLEHPTGVPLTDQTIAELLRLLEEHLGLHVVFVSQRAHDGARLPGIATRRSEEKPVGAGIGAPIRLADGRIYGMLNFFRREPEGQLDERDVRRLEMSARLAARLIDGADAHGIAAA